MRTVYEPQVWGDHLTAMERALADDLFTALRKRPGDAMTLEVRRTQDGRLILFRVGREELTTLRQRMV